MEKKILEIRNLTKGFGKRGGYESRVIKGINMDVYSGDFIAVMGPSGAGKDDTAYLGDLQRSMDITVLSDSQYEELRPCGSEMKIYNFKIADSDNPKNVDASADYIRSLSQQLEDGRYVVGSNIIYPESNEDSYIRVAYSICVFMFVTLILAAGSIIFLKVGNDAREDRERYTILKKSVFQKERRYGYKS